MKGKIKQTQKLYEEKKHIVQTIKNEMSKAIVGQAKLVNRLLVALLCQGHILLEGVPAIRSSFEDTATPVTDGNECECSTEGPDGYLDLVLEFKTEDIVEAIGHVYDGDVLELLLTGKLFNETVIIGADCILIQGEYNNEPHKVANPNPVNNRDADNKDVTITLCFFILLPPITFFSVVHIYHNIG